MNIQQLMQQAQRMQEQMQKQVAKTQEELAATEFTGESGAGLVKVVMNGRHDVRRVQIDDSLLKDARAVLKKADRALDGFDDAGPITAVGVVAKGLF